MLNAAKYYCILFFPIGVLPVSSTDCHYERSRKACDIVCSGPGAAGAIEPSDRQYRSAVHQLLGLRSSSFIWCWPISVHSF